jgi:hypothetical protein
MSWLYRREGRALLAYERRGAARARSFLLRHRQGSRAVPSLAPEVRAQCASHGQRRRRRLLSPDPARAVAVLAGEQAAGVHRRHGLLAQRRRGHLVRADMLPALRQRWPRLRFHIVGRSPTPAVRALAGEACQVTGTVPDVRPYLQHAAVVVAPLRLARGIQNKVLEAMAMARPVVAARTCVEAIDAAGPRTAGAPTTPTTLRAAVDAAGRPGHARRRSAPPGAKRVLQGLQLACPPAAFERHLPVASPEQPHERPP